MHNSCGRGVGVRLVLIYDGGVWHGTMVGERVGDVFVLAGNFSSVDDAFDEKYDEEQFGGENREVCLCVFHKYTT